MSTEVAIYRAKGGSFLSEKGEEFFERSLSRIEKQVEEIADVLFKGNGNALTSRILVVEKEVKDYKTDLEHMRESLHDLRNKALVSNLTAQQNELRLQDLNLKIVQYQKEIHERIELERVENKNNRQDFTLKIEKFKDSTWAKWWDVIKIVLAIIIAAIFSTVMLSHQMKAFLDKQQIQSRP